MLVLTRRLGETIIINNNIKIKVVGIKKSQVKLAIEAPKEITIYREEIYEKIKQENLNASDIDLNILKEVG